MVRLIRESTGVRYARTVSATCGFDLPADPMRLDPSVHAMDFDRLFELGEAFLRLQTDEKKLFYVWGHAYEFDFDDTWGRFEDFCRMMAGRDGISYVTNRQALGI